MSSFGRGVRAGIPPAGVSDYPTFLSCRHRFGLYLISADGQSDKTGSPPPMPKPAQETLKNCSTKIANSYSLLKDGKTEWTYKVTSVQRGKIDSIWAGMNRHEGFCATIDPN